MAITHFSGPVAVGSGSTENITAAKTLTADDNGKTFILKAAAGATITLPSVANGVATAGYRVEFIVGQLFATTDWTITEGASDTNIIATVTFEGDNTAAAGAAANSGHTNIILELGADTVGDRVSMMCDGTNWYAQVFVSKDAAVTLS